MSVPNIPASIITNSNAYSVNNSFDTPAGFSQGTAPFRTSPNDIWIGLAKIAGGGNFPLTIFHSSDNGVTWNTEDAANGPINSNSFGCVTWWDGARYLTALELDSVAFTIQLKKFDTVTKLWTVAFATGGPAAATGGCNAIFTRSDGKIAVLYQNRTGPVHNLMTLWNGATWSAPTTFDDNTSGVGASSVAAWISSTDQIHVLMIFTSSVLLAYQRINADSTLGPYFDLGANNLLFFNDAARNATDSFSITLNPAEDTVVIGATTAAYPNGKPCLLTGTPLAACNTLGAWTLGPALSLLTHSMYPQVYYSGANPVVMVQYENTPASDEPDAMAVGGNSPIAFSNVGVSIPPHLLFPVFRVTAGEVLAAYGGWDADGIAFFKASVSSLGIGSPDLLIFNMSNAPIAQLPDPRITCRKAKRRVSMLGLTLKRRKKRRC